jgi:uncharacterized protein (TIGR00725 family)
MISIQVAVIGGGVCGEDVSKTAEDLGRMIAESGHVLIMWRTWRLFMEAVCRGAKKAGGMAVGVLPGDKIDANPHVEIAIATGMGHARNAIIVRSADAVIALPGEYGTLSEIALALKMGKKVVSLKSWNVPGR